MNSVFALLSHVNSISLSYIIIEGNEKKLLKFPFASFRGIDLSFAGTRDWGEWLEGKVSYQHAQITYNNLRSLVPYSLKAALAAAYNKCIAQRYPKEF